MLPSTEWKNTTKKKYPIRYFLLYTLEGELDTIFRKCNDIKYWILYRVYPKYWNYWTVRPKTLKIGYHDTDALFLHSSMHLLCDFYEFTTSDKGSTDWNYGEAHRTVLATMKEIHDWWKIELPIKEAEIDQIYDDISDPIQTIEDLNNFRIENDVSKYESINKIEEYIEKMNTEMLHKLVDIRPFLWD